MGAADPAAVLAGVEWKVVRRLDGLVQGNYRTLFQGMGLDFSDLRPYAWGDDVRTIDWAVTARLDEPHVRRFHEDRDLTAWFLVDTSASLNFRTEGRTKADGARELMAAVATVLVRGGNRVGGCFFDGSLPRLVPPTSGRTAVLTLLRVAGAPAAEDVQPETDLGVLIDAMAGVLRRRSLVFLVSDFQGPGGWEAALGRLARRHEVLTVHLTDPSDGHLPNAGVVWMEDAETGKQLLVDTSSARFRRQYAALEAQRKATLKAAFRRCGVDPFELSTEHDLVRALLGWATRRAASPVGGRV